MSPESSKDVVMAVVIVLVVIIVGYLSYTRGFFNGQNQKTDGGVQVDIGGDHRIVPPPQ
jgi:hypothetical protein